MPVHLVPHPLVHDALATLRDASTPPELFRRMAVRISLLLAAEATRDVPSADGHGRDAARAGGGPPRSRGDVVVVPVLRAGLGMLDAVLELIPTARVGHIGLQRDEMTAVASQYYSKLPADLSGSFVLMIDPMLATGGSAVAALDLLRSAGARDVRMICIVAAPEGIALVEQHHPDVHIYTPVVDHGLNAHKFIVPASATSATAVRNAVTSTRRRADSHEARPTTGSAAVERRGQRARSTDDKWHTALTCIEPNKILVRGYPLDEMMGRLTFGEAIYLLLMGECRRPAIGRLMEAMLVSFIDHGATPPSTLAARNTATTGRAAARVRGGGRARVRPLSRRRHRELHAVSRRRPRAGAQRRVVPATPRRRSSTAGRQTGEALPGFGHRFHTRDPRAARLFQMALELEVEGEHIQMIRAVEMLLAHAASARRAAAAGQHRRRDRRGLRRPRHAADSPTRCSSSRACPASPRRRRKSASASSRCGRSIRRITSTTGRRSGGCRSGGSSDKSDSRADGSN